MHQYEGTREIRSGADRHRQGQSRLHEDHRAGQRTRRLAPGRSRQQRAERRHQHRRHHPTASRSTCCSRFPKTTCRPCCKQMHAGATLAVDVYDRAGRPQARQRHARQSRQPDRHQHRHGQGQGRIRQRRRKPVPEPVRQRARAARRDARRDRDSDLGAAARQRTVCSCTS